MSKALPSWAGRLAWFVALWAGGVVIVGCIAFVLRLWLKA